MNKGIMTAVGFGEAVAKVEAGDCPICTKAIVMAEFTDEESKKEFSISGMCQTCQDNFFGA
jgi:hypothetical protein